MALAQLPYFPHVGSVKIHITKSLPLEVSGLGFRPLCVFLKSLLEDMFFIDFEREKIGESETSMGKRISISCLPYAP